MTIHLTAKKKLQQSVHFPGYVSKFYNTAMEVHNLMFLCRGFITVIHRAVQILIRCELTKHISTYHAPENFLITCIVAASFIFATFYLPGKEKSLTFCVGWVLISANVKYMRFALFFISQLHPEFYLQPSLKRA